MKIDDKVKQAARIHAGIEPNKELDYHERYYNTHNCEKYDAFIAGYLFKKTESVSITAEQEEKYYKELN
jgi:hypothetical protein